MILFLIPALALIGLLLYLWFNGATRWNLMLDTLVQQYGERKGKLVTFVLFLLFLLGAFTIAYLRWSMYP